MYTSAALTNNKKYLRLQKRTSTATSEEQLVMTPST